MKIIKAIEPNPRTGMYDMEIAIEPGDRVVLIKGEDHQIVSEVKVAQPGQRYLEFKVKWRAANRESLGWGILDPQGKVAYWKWIEKPFDISWGDHVHITLSW